MNLLLTGINNYLGKELKAFLLKKKDKVTCLVRNEILFRQNYEDDPNLYIIRADLIREKYSEDLPTDLDAAYYFSNYTSEQGYIYQDLEILSIQNYIKQLRRVQCPHLIYVVPLRSPVNGLIKELLEASYIPYTIVRTSNLIGESSALIKIFEQMSSKLIIVSDSRLAKSRCQPIALNDALIYLDLIAHNLTTFNQIFDLCGPDTLSYQEMLEQYLEIKKIKRKIILLPFVHPNFSSFWLRRTSGIPKAMAKAFAENIQGDILCKNNAIQDLIPHSKLHFKEALQKAIH